MKKFLSLFAAVLFAASMMADSFAPKALADITADDVVVVTMDNGAGVYALANDKGTSSAPTAVAVTVTDGKISSDATNILWKVTKDGDNLSFIAGESNLYCTNTNNGVRVGSSTGTFIISNDYLCCTSTSSNRYLGVYNSQDWRCYTTINSNIQNQTLAFYVKETEQGGQGGDSGQTGESMTVYMLNNIGWNAVLAYVWTEENNNYDVYKTWPGDSAVKAAEQIYGMDVYSYTFPASYKNVIFNGGNNQPQTEDLTWSATKPYFLPNPESSISARTGTWYAREEIPSPTQSVDSMTIYMVNDLDWTTVNAYVWPATGTSYKAWPGEAMTKQAQQINGKDVYSYTFPASFVNVIFNNGNGGEGNQTENLTWNVAKPYFYAGAWYELDSIPAAGGEGGEEQETPILANGFYLIGQNGWTVADLNANLKFEATEANPSEYKLTVTLTKDDAIKVVKVENDAIVAWYPEGGNYVVDAAHAGADKDIYFQETYKEDWAAFGGYFWMGENQVLPVADFTQPFVLKFNGTGESGKDASAAFAADVAAIFDAASAPYVASVETATKVYAGRPIADDNSSVKFGTTSAQGTLAFTLAQAIEVDSIVVNATQYGNNAAKISVNGTEFDLTAGNKKPQDCKSVPEGAIDAITIAQTGSERIYLRYITVYPKSGSGETPQPEDSVTLYFVNVPAWEAVYAYTWLEGGAQNAEWPGEAMTPVNTQINEKDVYAYRFPSSMNNIIFNNGNGGEGNQTENLTWNAAKPYFYNGVWYELDSIPAAGGEGGEEQPETPVDSTTLYFVNVPAWESVYAYVYGTAEYKAWPGEAMTPVNTQINEKDVYAYTFPSSYDTFIIFNNGNDNQTENLTWNVAKPYFYAGAWYELDSIPAAGGEEQPVENVLPVVKLAGSLTSWEEPVLMVNAEDSLSASLTLNLGIDHYQLKVVSDDNWLSKYDESGMYTMHREWNHVDHLDLINTGENIKLITDVAGEYTFTWTYADSTLTVTFPQGETPQPEDSVTLYFVNVPAWEAVYAYTWIEGGAQNAEWPGEAMTPVNTQINEKDVYAYRFPSSMNNIIFNNGNGGEGNQTENLTWNAAKPYFYNGVWYELDSIPAAGGDDPEPETVTLYFINANGWENIHAYVWIDDNNQYVAWPGEEVTLTELTYNEMAIYSYTFPAIYNHIIFNGSLGEKSKQTLDLAVNAATPYLYVDTWYASLEEIPAVVVPAKFYVMMGGEAIKVTEDSYTIENLEADVEYSLKISLDGTWQTLMGYGFLTDIADGLHTNDAGDILFTLAEAGDVVVTYIAPATEGGEYTFTVTGNFVPYVEPTHTYTVAGPEAIFVSNWDPEYAANDMVKQEDGTYKWEQEGFEFAVGTIEFKVCKDHSWNPSYPAQGNYSLNILEDGIYTLTIYFNPAEASINAVATKTGDKQFDPTITYYLVGLNGDFTTKLEAYKLTETSDVEGQFEVTVTLAVGDAFKILAAQEGHQDVYFPGGLDNDYVVDADHAGEKTVYFRPDCQGYGWFYGCIYVPANEGTNIDSVNATVEAVKIFRNGQLLIIKGEKTYTIMGQVVK